MTHPAHRVDTARRAGTLGYMSDAMDKLLVIMRATADVGEAEDKLTRILLNLGVITKAEHDARRAAAQATRTALIDRAQAAFGA